MAEYQTWYAAELSVLPRRPLVAAAEKGVSSTLSRHCVSAQAVLSPSVRPGIPRSVGKRKEGFSREKWAPRESELNSRVFHGIAGEKAFAIIVLANRGHVSGKELN